MDQEKTGYRSHIGKIVQKHSKKSKKGLDIFARVDYIITVLALMRIEC